MEVEVRYVGEYRLLAGTGKEMVDVDDDGILDDVLTLLVERYGAEFGERVYTPEGELSETCTVFVGDIPAQNTGGLETPLTGEPIKLMFLGAIEGG